MRDIAIGFCGLSMIVSLSILLYVDQSWAIHLWKHGNKIRENIYDFIVWLLVGVVSVSVLGMVFSSAISK